MSEKKQETTHELYNRVHSKFYKMYKNIAMQVKIADEVIKEVGVREGNIIGQQTAAATVVIRGHKLVDGDKEARSTQERVEKLQSESIKNETQTKVA